MNPPRPCSSAFTLIELLTVIAIIGILAGIMIPTIGKVRRTANDAQCKTALRQWGMAIQLYIDDNKGRLPGPCTIGQTRKMSPIVDGKKASLFRYLAPYMMLKNNATALVPDSYICSAWVRDTPNPTADDAIVYNLRLPGDANRFPWRDNDEKPPLLYSEVLNLAPYHDRPAMIDIDAESAPDSVAPLPPRPVHDKHRNMLLYNWSVRAVPLNYQPSIP
ncbi:prepilin-type N-terminal cleavage/methylation domain-containing protein [Opitutaceae bacterium TAV4]|nr:prepilin-type N-terminal cleavage/methylation domain-containing protein [Opitutaceae bacterium TAV4]RRK01578.1 prepilin-type N-terminal cleavage/methylation domain-containing protein [Opitutaceae bacterium TAV3]